MSLAVDKGDILKSFTRVYSSIVTRSFTFYPHWPSSLTQLLSKPVVYVICYVDSRCEMELCGQMLHFLIHS